MTRSSSRRQGQSGVAAVEFALVLPIMILLFYGLVTFGSALYTQMVVTRAAEDGVRSARFLTTATSAAAIPNGAIALIKAEVINSLANSQIVPAGSNSSYADRRAWLQNNVLSNISVDNGSCGSSGVAPANTLRINIAFPFNKTRVLSSINLPPLGDFNSWMPATLTGCAIVQL